MTQGRLAGPIHRGIRRRSSHRTTVVVELATSSLKGTNLGSGQGVLPTCRHAKIYIKMAPKHTKPARSRFAYAVVLSWLKVLFNRLLRAIRVLTLVRGSAVMAELTISRYFCPSDEWDRMCESEYYRMSGIFREHLPPLERILQGEPRQLMFLGGPGMGLSTLSRQIGAHLSANGGTRVVAATLKEFGSNLASVLAAAERHNYPVAPIWYLLDDLDSVDGSLLPQLMADLHHLVSADTSLSHSRFCKQGYASIHAARLSAKYSRYCLLGLTTSDTQRVCDAAGIDAAGFEDELNRLDLGVESRNPAVLQTLIRFYERQRRLPETRYAAFVAIVQSLTDSIGVAAALAEECMRALGLAMELASRNNLLPQEAELAVGARLDVSPAEAAALLRRIAPFSFL